jgi:SWI/SNF-related matrix-associated actin-dependent regulator 1 of chromatin subfamily A
MLRARVSAVRPRRDGSFAVTLVMSAKSYAWMWVAAPPRLGALLEFEESEAEPYATPDGSEVLIIHGETRLIQEEWPRRFVPPPWLKAAAAASRYPLFPHQIEGAAWLAQRLAARQGAILADDQGLGKTAQTAAALLVARSLPAIIVCPSSLKRVWEREIRQTLIQPLVVTVLDGYDGPVPPAHIVIANYDLLREREQQLALLGARAIVFDEAQLLKEPVPTQAHRAAVATRLAHRIGAAVILSGTPLPTKVHELWRLLHVVDPGEWPAFEEFRDRYCRAPDPDDLDPDRNVVTEYGRVHHLDELQARMSPLMLRRLKSQVLRNSLPPKIRRSLVVELSEPERAMYDRVERDVVAWLKEAGLGARADAAKRGQAFVKLTMLRRFAAMAKLRRAIPEYLAHWFGKHGRGLVIFGFHRQVLAGVRRICQQMGLRVAAIRSRDNDQQRLASVDAFNAHQADVFIAPIRAAGVGLNLQHGGHHALFVERLFVPYVMQQAEDRIHRLGQEFQVTITYLDAARTVDEHIARVLSAKQALIDVVVDDRELDYEEMERQALDEVLEEVHGRATKDVGAQDEGVPR